MTRIVRDAGPAQTPRGLPAPLPPGERILWQGSPEWKALALRAMRLRGIAIYFALLAILRTGAALGDGESLAQALLAGSWLLAIGAVVIAMFVGYAWLAARAAIYTITNRRVILSFGVALPMSVNIPLTMIASAALKRDGRDVGDIPLVVNAPKRLSYVLLWPHVRPWRLSKVEPMFRAIPRAGEVAGILADALRGAHAENMRAENTQAADRESVQAPPRGPASEPSAQKPREDRGGAHSPVAA